MNEALKYEQEPQAFTPTAEVIDLEVVNKLLEHHREDYAGMTDIPYNENPKNERQDFVEYLKGIAENSTEPNSKAAAKQFLKEISSNPEEAYEN